MKKNVKVLAVAGVAAVALVGGTFAYYQSTLTLDNPLDTGHEGTVLVEEFTPPTDEWKPGESWAKEVGVVNTGDYPVLVRVKMDEKWVRKNATGEYGIVREMNSKNEAAFNSAIPGQGENGEVYYSAQQAVHSDPKVAGMDPAKDGLTENDHSVVYKNMLNLGGNANQWVFNDADGYWYYNGILAAAEDGKNGGSAPIMDKLVLASNIDLGLYETTEYYALGTQQPDVTAQHQKKDSQAIDTDIWRIAPWNDASDENDRAAQILQWTTDNKGYMDENNYKLFRLSESEIVTDYEGYADAMYTLTVTSEMVQANAEAVDAAWKNTFSDWRNILNNVHINSDNIVTETTTAVEP